MKQTLLIGVGLAIGLGLGLLYAWVIAPVQYIDTAPASLRADYQAEYMEWVAWAYRVDHDTARARARLVPLSNTDPAPRVAALAQQMAANHGDPATVQLLGELAAALGAGPATSTPASAASVTEASPTATASPTITLTPSATPMPTITPIPLPTRPPTPTPIGVLELASQQLVCDPKLVAPLIQVMTLDGTDRPIPGVEVLVEWDGGFDHFFTGLKPELGAGYGDFGMAADLTYTVRLAVNPSAAITGLAIPNCTDAAGQPYGGSWLLMFRP